MTDRISPDAQEFFDALNGALDSGAIVPVTETDAPALGEIGGALAEQGYTIDGSQDGDVVVTAPDGRSFTYRRQD